MSTDEYSEVEESEVNESEDSLTVDGSSASIVLGPIVGKVTSKSARILLEVDQECTVTCTASAGGGKKLRASAALRAYRPGVFKLTGLKANKEYKVIFDVTGGKERPATVRTLSSKMTEMQIAGVSCDKITSTIHDDLLPTLRDAVSSKEIDLVVHIGDQVYVDKAFKACAEEVKERGGGRSCKDSVDELGEHFREVYRATWGHEVTRDIYAQSSHLSIWDDHELTNDWGTMKPHRDKTSDVYFVGTVARHVYYEYQRQLWDDVDFDDLDTIETDAHVHVYGGVGVLFLDLRGGRTFHTGEDDGTFLGQPQWGMVEKALSKKGALKDVRKLVLVSSIPLVYSSGIMTCCIGCCCPCVVDKMGFHNFPDEQKKLLSTLAAWVADKDGREVVALCGDMHATSSADISLNGEVVVRQVVTSPVANTPPTGYKFTWMQFMSKEKLNIGDGWTSVRSEWTNKQNFATISIAVDEELGMTPQVNFAQ